MTQSSHVLAIVYVPMKYFIFNVTTKECVYKTICWQILAWLPWRPLERETGLLLEINDVLMKINFWGHCRLSRKQYDNFGRSKTNELIFVCVEMLNLWTPANAEIGLGVFILTENYEFLTHRSGQLKCWFQSWGNYML